MTPHSELVGNMVTVTNPNLDARWTGVAVAIAEHPVILIEDAGTGQRLMLPLNWAALAKPPAPTRICSDDRYIAGTFYMCDKRGSHSTHRDSASNVTWET